MTTTTLAPQQLLTPVAAEPLPPMTSEAMIAALAEAGLSGRGGAGFPAYRKFAAAVAAGRESGRTPVVVANGCEGEPASHKDKTLLRRNPHLVLDGLRAAAMAVGAQSAYLALEAGTGLAPTLRKIVEQRGEHVQVVEAPARFISGESTALTAFLNGRRALPFYQDVPARDVGVGGAPTLIQNVETLAQIALIARNGAAWFRSTETRLCTVHEVGAAPHVIEAEAATPTWRLLSGSDRPLQAILVGGYHGTWVPADEALLSDTGFGTGILAALPSSHCGLAETARVLRYLALQSAGQCGPCLNGLPRIAAAFADITDRNLADLHRWSGLVVGRGVCGHPDGAARIVRSALTTFAGEVEAHVSGRCTATDPTPLLPVREG